MKKLIAFIGGVIMYAMNLYSPDISDRIHLEQVYHMCGGKNISPELIWSRAPENTKSFAVTMFDPDAPTDHGWWHWMIVNIPKNVKIFPKGAGNPGDEYFNLGLQTLNDYGEIGYGGPCPPPGKPHRYIITVWALDVEGFNVPRNINPQQLIEVIKAHAIDSASIMGYYARGWR
ncbi:MAG: YbhB/YbcL family Raf kinase inhibitor-like protein [Nautiliaceae bacterium]